MKNGKKLILLILLNIIAIPVIVKFSYALNSDITSNTYEIKNNKIYAIPTTYNYRVEELLSNISSDKEIKVYNSNDEELKLGDNVYNGCKVKTESNSYEIVVMGDVTGDGLIEIGDISRLYNHYRGTKTFEGIDLEAGKLTDNDSIAIGDISKLYNYYRGKKAFSNYNQNMIDVDNIVDIAMCSSKKTGKNIIDELNVEHEDSDQVVVTRDGKVEVAIKKEDKCYRKSALSNYIDVAEDYFCNADITKFASNNGRLHVSGSKLLNEYNEEIRLTGVSNSEPPNNSEAIREQGTKMYTEKSLHTLHTWGGNVFRIFMNRKYVNWTGDQHDKLMNDLKDAMDNMIKNDMYIILNWSNGGLANKDYAKAFFEEISEVYPNDPHVIYEIWNEPNDVTWEEVKEYANYLIPVIRTKSPDAIVLVGSPKWDSRLDYVVADPLNIDNIMYSHHTYMNQFSPEHFGYLQQAIDAGLPIFETECQGVSSGTPTGSYINDAQAYSFFKKLENNNISYALFSWDSGMWTYNFVAYKEHKWDEELPDSILRESGKYAKRLLSNNLDTTAYMMKENLDPNNGTEYRSNEWKDKIISVSFKTEKIVPDDAVVTWDLSYLQDNTIIGYLKPSNTDNMYDLVIASDRTINLPSYSKYLFKGLSNVKSYDFTNARTDDVITTAFMFSANTAIESIDLSSFDTDDLVDIGYMFNGCTNLKSINFDTWKPVLYDFVNVFYNCSSLEELDLSGFNVSNARNFAGAFYNNTSLRTLNLNNWQVGTVTNLRNTFANMKSINNLDLSGFTQFRNDCDYYNVFSGINPNVEITTGNAEFKTNMQNAYPSLNIK